MCSFRRTPAGSCAGCSPRSSCAPRSARAAGPSRFSSNRRNACGSFRRCRRNWKVARPRSSTHYLAIDQTQPHLEVVHGLRHQRIALRPVVAPAGDQPDAYRIAPGQQPETVVLDLVNPVGAGRGLAGWGWEAGSMKLARSAGQALTHTLDQHTANLGGRGAESSPPPESTICRLPRRPP